MDEERDPEELDFAEMTTEELRDVLMTGGEITVDLGERVFAAVTLADVRVWVAISFKGVPLEELTRKLPGEVLLMVPPRTEEIIPRNSTHPSGETALLKRALEAREMLVGKPTKD